jgi:hypothetical protein
MANEGHVVTGHQGVAHVSAADAGLFNAGIAGSGKYVLFTGGRFSAATTSNTVTLQPGDLINQGRHISMQEVQSLTVENAPVGYTRKDRVVMRYNKDASTGVETADLLLVQGTPAQVNPESPEIVSGNIFNGALQDDFLLYGLTVGESGIQSIVTGFTRLPTIKQVEEQSATTYSNGTAGNAAIVQGANFKRCYLVKTGKTVRCYLGIGYADGTTPLPAGVTLFTIGSAWRPQERKIFPAVANRASGKTVAAGLEFNTNGFISHNSGSDITMIVGTAEWEVN